MYKSLATVVKTTCDFLIQPPVKYRPPTSGHQAGTQQAAEWLPSKNGKHKARTSQNSPSEDSIVYIEHVTAPVANQQQVSLARQQHLQVAALTC